MNSENATRYFGATNRNAMLLILAVAAVIRGLFLLLLPAQHLPDSVSYQSAAAAFRDFRLMTDNNIMPFYPLVVALVGQGWGQKFADFALSLATVWLVYRITARIYRDEAMALIAALFCALWPNFAFFAAVGLTETLFIALVLAAFLSLYGERYTIGSLFFVLAILTRPALEPLAPVLILIFSLAIHRSAYALAAKRIVAYCAIYIALMAPWWIYNYARYGQFVRLDLGGGIVFYTGNNPLNARGGGVGKGDTRDVDLGAIGKIADPVERDQAFRNAALRYIESDPWHFVSMMPVKFLRLWRPWPYAEEYQNALVLLASIVSTVPIFLLALTGLAFTLRSHFVLLLPCLTYLGFFTLVHMVTFGSVRYRVPLEPFVLVLAAAGLAGLIRRMSIGRRLLSALAPVH